MVLCACMHLYNKFARPVCAQRCPGCSIPRAERTGKRFSLHSCQRVLSILGPRLMCKSVLADQGPSEARAADGQVHPYLAVVQGPQGGATAVSTRAAAKRSSHAAGQVAPAPAQAPFWWRRSHCTPAPPQSDSLKAALRPSLPPHLRSTGRAANALCKQLQSLLLATLTGELEASYRADNHDHNSNCKIRAQESSPTAAPCFWAAQQLDLIQPAFQSPDIVSDSSPSVERPSSGEGGMGASAMPAKAARAAAVRWVRHRRSSSRSSLAGGARPTKSLLPLTTTWPGKVCWGSTGIALPATPCMRQQVIQ